VSDRGESQLASQFDGQKQRAAAAADFIERHGVRLKESTILDVGCSVGTFAWEFVNRGGRVEGIDPSEDYTRYGRETYELDLHAGMVEHFETDRRYDLITLIRCTNHFEQVDLILQRVRDLLQPDGRLYLEVLNFEHAIRRKSLDKCLKIDHPLLFQPRSLELLLRRFGFEVEHLEDDLDSKHEFHSLNHTHVIARKVEVPSDFVASIPSDARDRAIEQCLLSISNFHAQWVTRIEQEREDARARAAARRPKHLLRGLRRRVLSRGASGAR
jgi:SAM-dependent methyltransferase